MFIEPLEGRRLLALVAPTPLEVYFVELLNRARMNPDAEAKRLRMPSLNEGLPAGTIAKGPREPMVIEGNLVHSTRDYSKVLLNPPTGSNPSKGVLSHFIGGGPDVRAPQHGFGSSFVAENLAWVSGPLTIDAVHRQHELLFKDYTATFQYPGRGHRKNILDARWNLVGVGLAQGPFGKASTAATVTQQFSHSSQVPGMSDTFLTGVVIADKVVDDDFYQPGEGIKKIKVSARRLSDNKVFSTKTQAAGNYALALGPGAYEVYAGGGAFGAGVSHYVVIGDRNVKVDFIKRGNGDQTAPQAILNGNTLTPAGASHQIQVFFNDSTGIKSSSIGTGDIQVSRTGSVLATTLASITPSGDGTGLIATFNVSGPGGSWDPADNGVYTVKVLKNKVSDLTKKFVGAATLGTFSVNII